MKRWGAVLPVFAVLATAPQAAAESVRTLHTVSVSGIGRVPIPLTANVVEANTVYHQALAQAVGDGALKAGILTGQAHAKLGPLEAVSEGPASTLCKNTAGERGSYKGAEPDNGRVEGPVVALALAQASAPAASHKKKPATSHKKKLRRHRRILARKAELSPPPTCELTAEITLIYGIEA